jgi:hypothetical protein
VSSSVRPAGSKCLECGTPLGDCRALSGYCSDYCLLQAQQIPGNDHRLRRARSFGGGGPTDARSDPRPDGWSDVMHP